MQGLSLARRGSLCCSVERSLGGQRSCRTCSHPTRWCFACRRSTCLEKPIRSSRRRVTRALLPGSLSGSDVNATQSEVLAELYAETEASTGDRLRHTVTHPAGHRPLPPGRDAAAVVDSARTFLLAQRNC